MNNFKRILEESLSQPKDVLSIWDIGDESLDRYTVILDPKLGWEAKPGHFQSIGFSEGGVGVSQFGEAKPGKHLGKKIKWDDLSDASKKHITMRLK